MSKSTIQNKRVLAIDPSTRGFGFAVLEGPKSLIDWGVKDLVRKVRRKKPQINDVSVLQAKSLIEQFHPDVIVLEDYKGKGSRRCIRVRRLIRRTCQLAAARRIKVKAYSPGDVRKAFHPFGVRNKDQISNKIAEWFPELLPHLPPYRKPWMAEDSRMAIFDAMAMALTFYLPQKKAETTKTSDEKIQKQAA